MIHKIVTIVKSLTLNLGFQMCIQNKWEALCLKKWIKPYSPLFD